jgi:hypothetical protein
VELQEQGLGFLETAAPQDWEALNPQLMSLQCAGMFRRQSQQFGLTDNIR